MHLTQAVQTYAAPQMTVASPQFATSYGLPSVTNMAAAPAYGGYGVTAPTYGTAAYGAPTTMMGAPTTMMAAPTVI